MHQDAEIVAPLSELGMGPAPDSVRFTYSRPEQPRMRRALIRAIEVMTGQMRLARLYRAWSRSPPPGETIFAAAVRLMNLRIDTDDDAWHRLPRQGGLLVVANHPFGVVDGLVIGHLATRLRPDIKIMTHSLLCQPPEARDYLLPVDFGAGRAAQRTTLFTRRRAIDWLASGRALVVFPGGSVSTSCHPLRGPAVDPAWHPFVGKLACLPGVTTVPVFFHGQNSRLFQIASHVHYSLRIALLFRESARRIGTGVKVSVGEPVPAEALSVSGNRKRTMQDLRSRTYRLAGPGGPDIASEFCWPSHIRWD